MGPAFRNEHCKPVARHGRRRYRHLARTASAGPRAGRHLTSQARKHAQASFHPARRQAWVSLRG